MHRTIEEQRSPVVRPASRAVGGAFDPAESFAGFEDRSR